MSCAVKGCSNCRRLTVQNISFHLFPTNKDLQEEWLKVLGIDKEQWVWSKNKLVCSEHFKKNDFMGASGRRLRPSSIPSVKLIAAGLCDSSLSSSLPTEASTSKSVVQESSDPSFPINENLRQEWFRAIGKEFDERKFLYLCSNHFSSEDFVVKLAGNRYLKKDAIPKLMLGTENSFQGRSTSSCAKNTSMDRPSQDLIKTEVNYDTAESIPSDSADSWKIESIDDYVPLNQTGSDDEVKPLYVRKRCEGNEVSPLQVDNSNLVDSSESNLEDFTFLPDKNDESSNCDTDNIPQDILKHLLHPGPKRRFAQPRYFGDCDDSQISDPAKKNWFMARLTIDKQKKKIKTLQTAIIRLKTKNNTLNLLFKYLRDNGLVTETGHTVMGAFLRR